MKAQKICPQSTSLDLGILLHGAHRPRRLSRSIVYQEHKVSGGTAHASTVLLLLHNLLITPLCQATKTAILRQHGISKHTFWGLIVIPFVTRKLLSTSSERTLPEQVGPWSAGFKQFHQSAFFFCWEFVTDHDCLWVHSMLYDFARVPRMSAA